MDITKINLTSTHQQTLTHKPTNTIIKQVIEKEKKKGRNLGLPPSKRFFNVTSLMTRCVQGDMKVT